MLNHIVLMGRLTRDPELRYTSSQLPVTTFRIAVERDYSRGEERQTDFIDVVAWRHNAEFVRQYFQKGSMIVASGRLQMREWQDRDGSRRISAEVVAESVYFGESSRRDEGGSQRVPAVGPGIYSYETPAYTSAPQASPQQASPGGYSPQKQPYYQSSFSELTDSDDGELPF